MTGFWSTVIGKWLGAIMAVATIALVTGTVTHMFAFWEVQAYVTEHEEREIKEREELKQILDAVRAMTANQVEMQKQYEEIKGIILTPEVNGRATVGDFGFDDAFVDINEDGRASMYLGAESVMVTCIINGLPHTFELTVRGSFINRDDNGHLLIFSAKAGDDLGVMGIVEKVTIGPTAK